MKMFRKHYHNPQDKFDLLCRHLEQGEAVSKLCDEVGLCPAVFYQWKQTFFEAGEAALEDSQLDNDKLQLHQQIQVLQQKILRMNEDFVELKKELARYKIKLGISGKTDELS
ncbi:transposase [Crenothrix sp.]|uniref:transposase n=1 Tax=Crenothrix sp. TaxID=3100433 RepID=UPI00374CB4E1